MWFATLLDDIRECMTSPISDPRTSFRAEPFQGRICRSVRRGCWNGNGEVTQYAGSKAIRRLIRLAISFGLFDRQQFDNKVQICMWWHGGW